MNKFTNRVVRFGAVLSLLVVIAGCGSDLVQVAGTVYMDGEPLRRAGFVRIEPLDGRAAIGKINPEDGTFTMTSMDEGDGCLPGQHPVAVMVAVNIGERNFSLIDERYADSSRSGLTVDLSGSRSDLRIELTGGLRKLPRARAPIDEGLDR